MFDLKLKENTIKCMYNNKLQGSITVDNENVSLGVTEYINIGNRSLTLRSAVPESEFSNYNISKLLLDEAKMNGLISEEYFSSMTPETFGYQSYEALLIEENYADMSREELLQEIVDMNKILTTI